MSTTTATAELRTFRLHPSILLTLMEEQAGSLSKALAELVMNSIDAGATSIHITLNDTGFAVTDDGQGFVSREQIEDFFEMFGAPHEEGDAFYGRFRIGRGQIMSYAKTTWRSGPFEMNVDIRGAAADGNDIGYKLVTHNKKKKGCRIEGFFYKEHGNLFHVQNEIKDIVRYAPISVYLNKKQINNPPEKAEWSMEDENAWYLFDNQKHHKLTFYNRGVLVAEHDQNFYGACGVVVSKKPLRLNMARNAILTDKCEVWAEIHAKIKKRFMLQLQVAAGAKLALEEGRKLTRIILFEPGRLSEADIKRIRKIHFIPNIHGELSTPSNFFALPNYTLLDSRRPMVAERVERQRRASVVVPKMFEERHVSGGEEDYMENVYLMRSVLYPNAVRFQWIPFQNLVDELQDTHELVDDKDLSPEEFLVLDVLRRYDRNWGLSMSSGDQTPRELIVGKTDTMRAWTDGVSYIAINRRELYNFRNCCSGCKNNLGGVAGMLLLIVHEYCHDKTSVGEHPHDFNFYQRYHDRTISPGIDITVNHLFRRYLSAMSAAKITLSPDERYQITSIIGYAEKLRKRKRKSRGPQKT